MAAAATTHLRFSPLPNNTSIPKSRPSAVLKIKSFSYPLRSTSTSLSQSLTIDNSNNGGGFGKGGGSGGGGGNGGDAGGGDGDRSSSGSINPIAMFIEGWRSRVAADPEFPFKVLMEELVGVSATAVGDMATRPNFGLGELDFVFSTLVVGSIVNFTLMYLLAPTAAATASPAASAAASLPSYIFEPGPYSFPSRFATFVYKGVIFAAVGFASGLAGTAISNGLVSLRERGKGEEKGTEKPKKKKGPKTMLNAATWAVHMGLNSNLRYQTLNGVEFVMARAMPAALFKAAVVVLRCLNNVAGGMSFVMLGRLMGSQKAEEAEPQVDLKTE